MTDRHIEAIEARGPFIAHDHVLGGVVEWSVAENGLEFAFRTLPERPAILGGFVHNLAGILHWLPHPEIRNAVLDPSDLSVGTGARGLDPESERLTVALGVGQDIRAEIRAQLRKSFCRVIMDHPRAFAEAWTSTSDPLICELLSDYAAAAALGQDNAAMERRLRIQETLGQFDAQAAVVLAGAAIGRSYTAIVDGEYQLVRSRHKPDEPVVPFFRKEFEAAAQSMYSKDPWRTDVSFKRVLVEGGRTFVMGDEDPAAIDLMGLAAEADEARPAPRRR